MEASAKALSWLSGVAVETYHTLLSSDNRNAITFARRDCVRARNCAACLPDLFKVEQAKPLSY